MLIFVWLNLSAGSNDITAAEIFDILKGNNADTVAGKIVLQIRAPRIIAAILLGGALSVAGFLLQCFFGNPIAGPFVLGISSGAKLAVALVMVFSLKVGMFINSWIIVIFSFIGSLISMGIVLLFSVKVKNMSLLIVSGVMIGYICSAITELVVTFADDSNIVNLHNWSMGSFSGISWDDTGIIAIIVIIAFVCTFLSSKPLNAYQLGESYAESLGVNLRRFRIWIILLSSVLSACVTAFAGPVSFVGIAVPHLIKSMFGTAKPVITVPAVFLGGGVFCLFCDLISRTLFSPTELSISTVTAIFGAPVVIWIMLQRRRRQG